MKRAKNGRFMKESNIEIALPAPYSLFKYSILFIVLLPWVYLSLFKFDIISIFQDSSESLFNSNRCTCPNPKKEY